MGLVGGVVSALAELVLPRSCVACRASGTLLCPGCAPWAPFVATQGGLRTSAAGAYAAGLRAALLAYKERGRRDLVRPLSTLLSGAVGLSLGGLVRTGVVLVPVPSVASVARGRGGDHVLRLARRVGRELQIPVVCPLRLNRAVRDSASLRTRERIANLAGAMSARAGPSGAAALIVDDIVTTGATLGETARALRAADWPVLGASVVAATPHRRATRPPAGHPQELMWILPWARPPSGTSRPSGLAWS